MMLVDVDDDIWRISRNILQENMAQKCELVAQENIGVGTHKHNRMTVWFSKTMLKPGITQSQFAPGLVQQRVEILNKGC